MKTKSFLVLCIVIMHLSAISQVKIGSNATTINSASLLELESTSKGFVLPRVSITDVSSSSPLNAGLLTGTVVYNTNSSTTGGSGAGIYYWDGTQWNFLANTTITGNYWSLTGNSGTSPSSNFIGTTDAKDFVVRTNNVERMRILGATVGSSQVGWIGMGISTTPKSALDVAGNYSGKNVITIQNTSTTGFSSVDMLDNSGNLATTFGFANSGTGTAFSGKAYLNGYGNDFLFTRGSSYDLIMKGSNGYVGLNTGTPSERLHVVGNFYLTGAFMPGGLAGTSGYVLTSAGANTAPTWNNLNGLSWNLLGNSGTSASTNFIGTTDAVDFVARTSNIERLRITSTGNVGIGLTNPAYKLAVLSASNPLYLSGVQATSTFSSDSVLTINSGVVKKSPYSSLLNLGWSLTGNSGTNYSNNFIGTTDNISMRFRTNNVQRMIIDSLGKVGIGLSNPAYALSVLSASNPLYLSGVQATSTLSADSILTINSGIVKKTPYSSLSNYWSLTGNSGTDYATNFLGTTDNVSLRFRTNNTEQMILDSLGNLSIGYYGASSFNPGNPPRLSVDYGTTTSNTIAYLRGSIDDYFQINLRNKSSGTSASTDYVATADDGTDSTYYVDLGINSSAYSPSVDNFGGKHDAYLYASSRNLLIGTAAANSDIVFLLAGGRSKYNTAMRMDATNGNIIIGTGDNNDNATGNTIRAPNGKGTNIAGGILTLQGGSATGTATGGNLNLYGGSTVSGTAGSVNINASTNSATNINTGTSASDVTIGNALNNINLPKLSASSVVLTDASKNLTSTTPSNNTYLYYNGTNFTWQSAATLASFSVTAPLTYNNLTGVFGITKANTATDGYLSSTDWNTFNNKVGSITLNTPSSVFSNPINFAVTTGAATGTLSLNTQAAGTVFAGPVNVASGTPAAVPTFRALVAADIPSLSANYIQNQITLQASSNFNISGNGTIGTNLNVTGTSTLTGLVTSKAGHTNTGAFTTAGGATNINASSNFATNINTGTSNSNVTIGGAGNNIILPKFTTVGGMYFNSLATGQLANTGSNMTWDSINNRLGIGISSPGYKLSVLAASNPLYLSGVQATSTFSSDSILTINAGIVKASPYSSLTGGFSATAPLTYNSTTGVFSINQSTTSTDGYLSSTDWNTFNNKVGSITLNTPSSVFSNPINFSVSSGTAIGTLSLNTQTANTVFAGPASGAVATPTFRTLVASDIPSLAGSYIQNQTTQQASSNFNISGTGTVGGVLTSNGGHTNVGALTTSGGIVNVNASSNFATNINTGTSTGNITVGNSSNNILFPKFNTAGGMIYTTAATGQIASTGSNMKWDDVNNRLGIGLTNPSYKLSVLAASDPLYLSGVQVTSTFSTDSILTILNGVVKKAPYSSLTGNFWSLTGNSSTIAGTNFIGTNDAVDFVTKTNNAERMRITSGGLVGIGTNAPASDLTVFQSAGSGSSRGITFTGNSISGTNSGTGFLMSLGYNSAGNKQLWFGDADYAGNATGSFARFVSTGTSFPVFDAVSGSGASRRYMAFGVAGDANSGVIFGTDNSNVSPGSQVWDNGNMTIGASYKSFAAPTDGLLVQGNVGIGTTSPSSALHVVGTNPLTLIGVQATAAFTTDSVLTIYNGVIKKSPYSSLPGGNSWSLTGNAAASGSFLGTTNTTPLQFKFNSTGAGYLDANNTSFGTSSSSTTGSSNTAIGFSATASNSSTAVGANANASQANNTAIGNSATANTSSQATAIGASSQALFQNNTAVGYNAQATTSSQETVVGASTLAQGQNNIAIGYSAKAINSDKITVVGSNAQASFQNNTVLGSSALATTNNQATAIGATATAQAQNATALGYGSSATGTNSTAIGSSATTSQNNALILGTSTTNVGIRTSTPNTTAALDVNANFKLGDIGTVNKNVVSFSAALGSTSLAAGTGIVNVFSGILTFSASSTDVTVTIPSAANYLTSSQATVEVSPNFDLPTSVSIASARMISTSQVKIRFVNSSTTAQSVSGNLYITINEF